MLAATPPLLTTLFLPCWYPGMCYLLPWSCQKPLPQPRAPQTWRRLQNLEQVWFFYILYIYFLFIRPSLMGSKDSFLYFARAWEKVWRVLVGVTCWRSTVCQPPVNSNGFLKGNEEFHKEAMTSVSCTFNSNVICCILHLVILSMIQTISVLITHERCGRFDIFQGFREGLYCVASEVFLIL